MSLLRIQNSWLARPRGVAVSSHHNQASQSRSILFRKLPRTYSTTRGTFPRALQPSIWQSIVPKTFREPSSNTVPAKSARRKDWNPATFFIVIFLLIGSNAIQMIALRNDFLSFSRKSDAKIGLLREVIERVQRGEDVDVEGLLGTGDEEKEREWEEVIREIEDADRNWDPSARRRKDRKPAESKGEKPSPSRQSDAEMKTMPGSTNPNGSPLNVTNPKSTPVGTPKEMFPRGFY